MGALCFVVALGALHLLWESIELVKHNSRTLFANGLLKCRSILMTVLRLMMRHLTTLLAQKLVPLT